MPIRSAIRNPLSWSADQAKLTALAVKSAAHAFLHTEADLNIPRPEVRRITVSDLKDVLIDGLSDFAAFRTDVIFICLIYPLAGLALARFALNYGVLPLLFPLASGFALIGPFAAAGLYEMSRRRERGMPVAWSGAFGVFGSPSIAAIIKLGLVLTGIFLFWLSAAMMIYRLTLGPAMPTSASSFVTHIFTTTAGRTMVGVGVGVGFLFALVVPAISVVSFPLLLDRRVRISTAVWASVRAVIHNPVPMLVWGLIVAAGLLLGAIPVLSGLIVVMPVLGHATWHLYRKVVL